jgi:dTDP-4-dehydrorhamnose reductase
LCVLIIDASGLIGGALLVEFSDHQETVGTYNSFPVGGLTRVDISDLEAIRRLTEQSGPQVILQPAALTAADYCESHPDEAWRINMDGTRSITEAASRLGARHMFFSKEYVVDKAQRRLSTPLQGVEAGLTAMREEQPR